MMASDDIDFDDEVDLENEDLTPRYFNGLMHKDRSERTAFIDALTKSLQLWIDRKQDQFAKKLLENHLPTVLTLSVNCPFEDVQRRLTDLLEMTRVSVLIHGEGTFKVHKFSFFWKEAGLAVPTRVFRGPSSFIPAEKVRVLFIKYTHCV